MRDLCLCGVAVTDAPSVLSACTCCVLQDHADLCQAVALCRFLSASIRRQCSSQVPRRQDPVTPPPSPPPFLTFFTSPVCVIHVNHEAAPASGAGSYRNMLPVLTVNQRWTLRDRGCPLWEQLICFLRWKGWSWAP